MKKIRKKDKVKIDSVTAAFMIATALFFDGVQAFLTLILIGPFVNWMISIMAWLTFFLWLSIKGVRFTQNPKNFFTFNGGALCEMVPLVASLPAWTLAITTLVMMNKIKTVL